MSVKQSTTVLPYTPTPGAKPIKDLSGQIFDRLTALEPVRFVCKDASKTRLGFRCACICGTITHVRATQLLSGQTRSCGCLERETRIQSGRNNAKHLMCGTPTYNTWQAILDRCNRPQSKDWPRYGGRGITVCERWQTFENFLADMGERPKGKTIDRRDVDGNYEKDNCVWATPTQQQRNRRCNRRITINGETKTLSEWAEIAGLSMTTLSRRLKRGIAPETAIATPAREQPPLVVNGIAKTMTEWAEIAGITVSAIHYRLKRGLSPEEAIRAEHFSTARKR